MDSVFDNCRLVQDGSLVSSRVLVSEGVIVGVGGFSTPSSFQRVDCGGKVLLPGVIDPHVHFMSPGNGKDDWFSGSRAAAKGGVTTVLDMPDNDPPATTWKLLDGKRSAAGKQSIVDYGFHFAGTAGNLEEIRSIRNVASVKVFMGASGDGLVVGNDADLFDVFSAAKENDLLVAVHAENDALARAFEKGVNGSSDPSVHARVRPPICAAEAASRAAIISKVVGNRLHLLHVSTRKELDVLRYSRGRVTAEATPHHLFLSDSDLGTLGNFGKTNPPLRELADREALWGALDLITCFATDHSPHTRDEKSSEFKEAPAGVPGVEYMLPLLLNEVVKGTLSWDDLVRRTSGNPAELFGLSGKGFIRTGFDADFVLVDMEKEKEITSDDVASKCGWTPYVGFLLRGWPEKTWVRGNLVYDDGEFLENEGLEAF
ncbi:MAG: dihydroorotase family protein [Candidatus Diapherotrites archaeon]|nr:dihydroorotase family protein [Candidatus Diapherotrites archaeon]